ncbi:ATP-binding protein [Streptomyces sp. NBC_01754]|uniref:ATP-binding protein n=1 Tax=Streptomyces sp. NBC_01754 TaxID=2975930 RepID=UPI002DD86F57|nr:ATP-binding protein [Streptomyces sp. NBC_01754]WSC92465.1 ATP-binding protein [Streptomyces sp. NBC_01754]
MTSPAEAPAPVLTFTQRFSATRRGARLARYLAVQRLDAWGVSYGTQASDTVALVTAELAANAVLHGRVAGRDFALGVVYERGTARVRIEVSDTHPGMPVERARGGPDGMGRGLVLVGALATRWGVTGRLGPGKTVWAEVAVPGAPDRTKGGTGQGRAGR